MTFEIGVAVAAIAFGIGIWLGLPGRYQADEDEIESIMESGGGRRRQVRRSFTPMAWLKRQVSPRRLAGRSRRGFKLESPDDR